MPNDEKLEPKDFQDVYQMVLDQGRRIGVLETAQRGFKTALTAKLEEEKHYCTDCGIEVGEYDRCENHPGAKVNHEGTDPRTGETIVLRTS